MSAKNFFTQDQQVLIQQAIAAAELNTSGEIRVHIDDKCKEDVLDTAANLFHHLKMDATALHNGVLFYLAVDDHKFAIIGDKGINEKVPLDFWDHIKETMLDHFMHADFTGGLCKGIEMAGEKLKAHFPLQTDDSNELSDDMSFGS
ncbi:MAG: TPM domain-containing protein [Bacteroidota bacterium]|nr:TPM domain-containing protein [Bacteroidota bacterium]